MSYIDFSGRRADVRRGYAKINALDGASFTVEKGELASSWAPRARARPLPSTSWAAWTAPPPAPFRWTAATYPHASENDLVLYRRADVGFVFQFYNLVPNLTALENVELATQICPTP